MKVPDANLLLYTVNKSAVFHRGAMAWLSTVIGEGQLALTWGTLQAFLRVSTKPFFPHQLTVDQAFQMIDWWAESQGTRILLPGPNHRERLRSLLVPIGTAGDLTSDAHLAAIVMEHGAELFTFDGDFAKFPGLRWTRLGGNP